MEQIIREDLSKMIEDINPFIHYYGSDSFDDEHDDENLGSYIVFDPKESFVNVKKTLNDYFQTDADSKTEIALGLEDATILFKHIIEQLFNMGRDLGNLRTEIRELKLSFQNPPPSIDLPSGGKRKTKKNKKNN